jgi:hypothetical protein
MRGCGGRSSRRRPPCSCRRRPAGRRRPARAATCRPARWAAIGERAADSRRRWTAPERAFRLAVSTPEAPDCSHTQRPTTADRYRAETAPARDASEKRSVLSVISRCHSARSRAVRRSSDLQSWRQLLAAFSPAPRVAQSATGLAFGSTGRVRVGMPSSDGQEATRSSAGSHQRSRGRAQRRGSTR